MSTYRLFTDLVDKLGKNNGKLVVTPTFVIPNNTCSVTIKSNKGKFKTEKIFNLYNSKTFPLKTANFNNEECLSLKDTKAKLKNRLSFLLSIKSEINFEIKIVFNKCPKLVSITGPFTNNLINKKNHINLLNHDKCDFEYITNENGMNCNWMEIIPKIDELTSSKNGNYQSKFRILYLNEDTHPECTKLGVKDKILPNSYFFNLHQTAASGDKFTTAIMTSLIFDVSDFARVGFSMHYSLHCEGSKLSAYLIRECGDLIKLISTRRPFIELINDSFHWQFLRENIDVSNLTGIYRVSLDCF